MEIFTSLTTLAEIGGKWLSFSARIANRIAVIYFVNFAKIRIQFKWRMVYFLCCIG